MEKLEVEGNDQREHIKRKRLISRPEPEVDIVSVGLGVLLEAPVLNKNIIGSELEVSMVYNEDQETDARQHHQRLSGLVLELLGATPLLPGPTGSKLMR